MRPTTLSSVFSFNVRKVKRHLEKALLLITGDEVLLVQLNFFVSKNNEMSLFFTVFCVSPRKVHLQNGIFVSSLSNGGGFMLSLSKTPGDLVHRKGKSEAGA
ncbi:hypothetical protein NDU88_007414 [Pleurodeles waltl]|uniref:Uncharacterized protein n=1 Tax=Pleurodeles waltl TaxID=8319 RepID=A0AAV7U166_PLEWA|nr:hypothetical protein NDU88_007414 [Pleurodeles waltl]